MEPGIVLKYFEPLDVFVRVRRYTPDEIAQLLSTAKITDRRSYVGLVVNACIVDLSPRHLEHEELLYGLCIDVNPALDIRKVTITTKEEARQIHLLEGAPAAPAQDFRRLKDMEEALSRRIVGQEAAIAAVSRAVKKSMTGLRDPHRPMATFFFVGQTGVGKTELAKELTVYLFHDPSRMLRIDCSEYSLPHEYAKLIGAPPGYIGHDQRGVLSEVAQAQGPLTVLFDEIEKSDGKVHNLLLQVMDEGFVTDNKGSRVSFSDAILIFTSNVGSEEAEALRHRIGFAKPHADRAEQMEEFFRAIKASFRPEFVNRITEVVFFNPIGLEECERIARIFLEQVKKHAERVPLKVRYEPRVCRWLAEKSYRPEFGARELRRTVEKEVEGVISDLLIEGRLREGDTVVVRLSRDRLEFSRN
ncbi:MAG TPA: AAA family ATPase [Planctomycetota bacterium]|nr:AAA family ATPase [Planctomycetota bacterium]